MCAWVRIPLLSELFKHCEVSHELKTMQNHKQFCFWKPSGIRARLDSSRSKLLLHQSVLGFKTYPCKNTKIKWMHLVKCWTFLHWQNWLFDDQLITLKMKFQQLETICQNKLRIWTVQNGKITANNPNGNLQYNLEGRMAERSKEPDSRKLLARDFWNRMCAWVQTPLLSEVFNHWEVSHELKRMQNQKQFCFWKPSGIRTRLDSSRSKLLLHQSVFGFKTYHCKNTKIKLMHLVKCCTFLHWQNWLFDDQLITLKMKFQQLETICQNKLRIWTVQNGKITANNPNGNLQYNLERRMAERSKEPDSRKLVARDFWNRMCAWVQTPLLSEVFNHWEESHELKRMQNQRQFCFWKPSGIRTRLDSSRSKLLLHQSVLGFESYPCKNTKIKWMHLVKCTFLHWQNWLSMIN